VRGSGLECGQRRISPSHCGKERDMLKTGYVKFVVAFAAVASFAVASGAGARWK
jgi:hypothetical protein